MPAHLAADLVLLLHLAFIIFVIFGGLLTLYHRLFAWLHIPTALWGAVVNLASWQCPLTPLENHYRILAGQSGYQSGFVEHYIAPLVYPSGISGDPGLTIGIAVIMWNGLVYGLLLYRHQRKKRTITR